MRRAQYKQRDLFQKCPGIRVFQREVQAKLNPLLQILLAEAAQVGTRRVKEETSAGKENGDDQDHV